jgi:hypothetical protein
MQTPKSTLCAMAIGGLCAVAQAGTQVGVVFDDPQALYAAYYGQIEQTTVAAGNAWIGLFRNGGMDGELSVNVSFADIASAQGNSMASALLGPGPGGVSVYEQGAAYEVATGIDANGAAADIQITLGIGGYLQNELWFDPDPVHRPGSVPADRTDAMSVLLHEFGHAFGFNGWRNGFSGDLPGNYGSSFDALVQPMSTAAGTALYFRGAAAMALYGGPVPLTLGSYGHLGNNGLTLGDDLVPDLMNGVAFYRGTRYDISMLDQGIMQDIGLSLASPVPEPGGLATSLAGVVALLAWRRRRGVLLVAAALAAGTASAATSWSIGIQVPGVSIGVQVPSYPQLVPVPGYPVYYAPGLRSNYFFYDGVYWVYQDDNWYASTWYDGPWGLADPESVPLFVLRIPVRYYRSPPTYFRRWRPEAAPRWDEHWGPGWQNQHQGWDRWDRRWAPAPAPLPRYQRQYPSTRYPTPQEQRQLHQQNYRYQPREPAREQAHEPTREPNRKPEQGGGRDRAPERERDGGDGREPGRKPHAP